MEKAERFVSDMTYEEFINDEKTIFAVIRAIEIVGEAIKHDGLAKSRHSRVGGNPGPTKPIEKTGFPFPRE